MPEQEHKELIRRFYEEVWDRGNLDVCDEVFAPGYERHDFRSTEPVSGPEGQKQIAADFRAAFPDLHFVVDLLVAEDDYVVGRWTATGVHSCRWGTVEPTGRSVRFSGANIFRFESGKVVEIWTHRDDLGLREQLGGAAVYAGAQPGE